MKAYLIREQKPFPMVIFEIDQPVPKMLVVEEPEPEKRQIRFNLQTLTDIAVYREECEIPI